MATEKIFFAVEVDSGKSITTLEKLRANFKGLQAEIKSVERAQKRGSITASEANKKLSELDRQLIKARGSYTKANKAALEMEKSVSIGARSFLKAEKAAKAAEKSVSKGARSFLKAASAAKKLGKEQEKLKKNSLSLTKVMQGAGLAITGAFAARALLSGAKETLKIIKDFDQASANLAAVLGKNKDEIDELTDSAMRLGSVTSFTASQVLELSTELAKLGFTEQEILDSTEAILSLAEAAGVELAQAAKVAGSTIRAFGLEASDAGMVADVMAKSFSSSALDMSKFETAMASVAPVASKLGFTLEATAAQLGKIVDNGIDASTAGTALRSIMLDSAKAGMSLDESLNLINTSSDKAGTAFRLFGKRGAAVSLVMAENVGSAERLKFALENSGGAAKRMAETQLDTLEGKTKLLTSAWEGFVLALDSGDGAISNVTAGILDLTTSMLNLLTPGEGLAKTFIRSRDAFVLLEKNIPPLLARYDELKEKAERLGSVTSLNTEEQEEFKSILAKVSSEFPLSVSAIDKYGKAVEINTKRTGQMLEGQRVFNNELKNKAIKDTEEDLVNLNLKLERLGKLWKHVDGELLKYNRGMDKATNGKIKFIEATEEEALAFRKSTLGVQLRIDAQEALLDVVKNGRKIIESEIEIIEDEDDTLKRTIETITTLREKQSDLTNQRDELSTADKAGIIVLNDEIKAVEEKIKILTELETIEETFHFRTLGRMKAEALELEKEDNSEFNAFKDRADRLKKQADELKEDQEIREQAEEDSRILLQDSITQHLAGIQDLTNVFTDNKLKTLEAETKAELAIINQREEDGLLTEQQADKARRKLAVDSDAKSEAIEKKAFQRNKAFNLASTIIEISLAVSRALASLPPPLSFAAAATTGALGAVQVATIAAEKFAKGGVIQGNSHANGGVPVLGGTAEVEGGEIILTKGVAQNPSLFAAANSLNMLAGGQSLTGGKNNMASGGILSNNLPTFALPEVGGGQNFNDIVDAISELRVMVEVSEISNAQSNIIAVEVQSSI